jgi:hypothetical protein
LEGIHVAQDGQNIVFLWTQAWINCTMTDFFASVLWIKCVYTVQELANASLMVLCPITLYFPIPQILE